MGASAIYKWLRRRQAHYQWLCGIIGAWVDEVYWQEPTVFWWYYQMVSETRCSSSWWYLLSSLYLFWWKLCCGIYFNLRNKVFFQNWNILPYLVKNYQFFSTYQSYHWLAFLDRKLVEIFQTLAILYQSLVKCMKVAVSWYLQKISMFSIICCKNLPNNGRIFI